MKISLIEPLNVSKELIDKFESEIHSLGHEFRYYDDKTTDINELRRRSDGQDIVMIANNPYPKEVIDSLENLKLLNVAFTGVDHVDLDALKNKGAKLCNASGYSDIAVSELVIGLAINLFRNIKISDTSIRDSGLPIMGRELSGKTLGILGTGNIGLRTAKLFDAFGSEILGYDLNENEEFLAIGGKYTSLEDILSKADILSIHLPNTKNTKGFIGEKELKMMKESSILINCARGPIVDNNALADALNNGVIAGAGLDVFDMEPPIPADYPLLNAKNTVLTPHIAYLTEESMVRRAEIAFDNTISFLKGEGKNLIDL